MLFVCMCMDVYLGGVCEIVQACCLYVYGCVSWGCVCDCVGMLSVCVWTCILGVCVRLCGHVVCMCMDVYLGGGVCVWYPSHPICSSWNPGHHHGQSCLTHQEVLLPHLA